MERYPERLGEHEQAEHAGHDPCGDDYRAELPGIRGSAELGPDEYPERYQAGAEPEVADHEREEQRECDEQNGRGVDLIVLGRRDQIDEELEWFHGPRVLQLHGRLALLLSGERLDEREAAA